VRHSIPIEEGQAVPYGPTYVLRANELRVLREFLRGDAFARANPPAGAPIFVQNKDVKPSKCEFASEGIDFLGYHVDTTGISVDRRNRGTGHA